MNMLLATVALASVWCTGCGKSSPDTSNTVVVSNGVIVVDTREKIQFDAPDYNNYLQELNIAAEKGADSKFTLHVVDQDGKEVADAEVEVLFPFNGRKGNTLSGKTDVHGLFSVEDKTTGEPSFIVMKKGYYRTSSNFGILKIGTRCLQNGRWIPWNPTIHVTLKEIRKPIPMIVKKIEAALPKNEEIGFDCMAGEFLAPYGSGKIADLTFYYTSECSVWYDGNMTNKLDIITHSHGGLYQRKKDEYSILRSSHEAPIDGCQPKITYSLKRTEAKIIEQIDLPESDYLIFSTRGEKDSQGVICKQHFGKIYSLLYGENPDKKNSVVIRFTYYLNPTPNDRNLEFDGKNNLLKEQSPRERRVYTP